LAPWEGSVIWRDGVVTSTGGEAAPGRGKEEDDTSWANANLTRPKSEKIHVIDSAATNRC
jgi:hypothetical protein